MHTSPASCIKFDCRQTCSDTILDAVKHVKLHGHLYVGVHAGFGHNAVESGYCELPDKCCLARKPPELHACWASAVCCLLVAIKCMGACSNTNLDLAQCMIDSC